MEGKAKYIERRENSIKLHSRVKMTKNKGRERVERNCGELLISDTQEPVQQRRLTDAMIKG